MNLENPNDRDRVVDALAAKVWRDESRRSQLESHGLKSQADVKKHVSATIENQKTKAFGCQPKNDRGHPVLGEQFPRYVFDLRRFDDSKGKEYSSTIVLNPNPDPRRPGEPYGGTLVITSRNELSRLHQRERDVTGIKQEIVIGGLTALHEQSRHRQLVSHEPTVPPRFDPKHAREELTPARVKPEAVPERKGPQSQRPPAFDPKHSREPIAPERRQVPSAVPRRTEEPKKAPGLYEQYMADRNTRGRKITDDR